MRRAENCLRRRAFRLMQGDTVSLLATIRQAINTTDKPRSRLLKETGISQSQLSRLMEGEGQLSLPKLEKLAHSLDLEIIARQRSKSARPAPAARKAGPRASRGSSPALELQLRANDLGDDQA